MAEPTYRMSMLPFGTYPNEDGQGEHLGFAMPGMIQEPINALSRLFGTPSNPGTFGQGPDAPGNADDMRTLLMSVYGGNAMTPGRLMEGAAAKAAPQAAHEAPYAMYRGAPNADGLFPTDRPLFMSSSPDVAGTYAGTFPDGPGVSLDDWTQPAVGSVAPMRADFANPLVVDAQGRAWNDIPFNGNWTDSNALTYWARDAGHDGLVIKNVTDHLGAPGSVPPADTVVALKRGTISSPLTGETLYSDTGRPSLFGSAIAGAEHPIGHMPSDLIEQAGAAGTIPYAGVGQLSSTDTLVHQLMANRPTVSVKTGERIAGTNDRQGPPLTTYDTIALDQAWRDKIRRTGELYSDGLPSIWGNALAPSQDEPRNALMDYAQNNQAPGNYLKDRMNQPYQPAPGEDFQYTPITPEISSKLSTFAAPLIEKMMKSNPGMDRYTAGDKVRKSQEFRQYKRTLVKPQPFNPPPSP